MAARSVKLSQAFSLVELSIVLVILGLLVGGILAGQSLIRASELRSVGTQQQAYRAAVHVFRDKYFFLPGDMPNATDVWGLLGGTVAANDATCRPLAATGTTATCNGNGDGFLYTAAAYNGEPTRFWQQLSNAGLIEGVYTGTLTGGLARGTNVPGERVTNDGYWLARATNVMVMPATTSAYGGAWGNYMYISRTAASNLTAGSYVFLPEEAWNLDAKTDDGMPGMGSIIAGTKGDGTNTFCTSVAGTSGAGDAASTYRVDYKSKDCVIQYLRVF